MLNIIKTPDLLWQECIKLSKNPSVIDSEFFDERDNHFVLAYGPVAQRNKFQSLLYSAKNQFNASILPIHDLSLCGDIPWPGKVVCHFHWVHEKTKAATTESEAEEAVLYWDKLLRRIKENGHMIVWTVHNIMPHETVWIEHDKKIHQLLADAADALHIMTSDTRRLALPYYNLDEQKIFIVPHPTYEGAQPDNLSRSNARTQLQIDEDEFVFLSFGAIMNYKGHDRLMAAYDELSEIKAKRTKLIIAGLPNDQAIVHQILEWGSNRLDVILDMSPVPDDKLQVYFRSADLAVYPYRRTMNSGASMMAMTFNLPVLGPDCGGFLDIEAIGCGATFDNSSNSSLRDKMHLAMDRGIANAKEIAKAKQSLSPLSISSQFFSNIKGLLN